MADLFGHAAELEAMAAAARLRAEVLAGEIEAEAVEDAAQETAFRAAFEALSPSDLSAAWKLSRRSRWSA